jgi:Ca2+-binding RTX toxin-like protein
VLNDRPGEGEKMAVAKYYQQTDMLKYDWVYGFPTDEAKLRSNYIYNTFDPGDTVVYRGSFAYYAIADAGGATTILGLRSGTITGYEWYEDQILRAQISGLNYDAMVAFVYMQYGDQRGKIGAAYNLELSQELFAGNDSITGSAFDDTLAGFDGNDTLSGGRRFDVLIGGNGADTLTGGNRNDTFLYNKPSEGGDTITDFSGDPTNNDRFQFSASGFGGGLVAGVALTDAQFQTSVAPGAKTADVRFIFDSDDYKLWFDADGNGAGAAVLITTLQAGAVVTPDDFQII